MIYRTYCPVRLGDNLAHLHFLRALAMGYPQHHFIHYAHLAYLPQLIEVASDVPNLQVLDLESVDDGTQNHWNMRPTYDDAINAWKNADGFWENHILKFCWVDFQLVLCDRLARAMGLRSPFSTRDDLLFNYPALKRYQFQPFDCLVVNSRPMSGQLSGINADDMDRIVGHIAQRMSVVTTHPSKHGVPCTQHNQLTVTQIGALSRFCRFIVAVSTGPSWPTWNVFNLDSVEQRVVLLDKESIRLTDNTLHAGTYENTIIALRGAGIL